MVQGNFLYLVVLEPTRGESYTGLVFSNGENIVKNLEIGEAAGNSDRNSIRFNIILTDKAYENRDYT